MEDDKPPPLGAAHHYDLNLKDDDGVVRALVALGEFLIKEMPKVAAALPGNRGEANETETLRCRVKDLRKALDNEHGFAVGEVRYNIDTMLEIFQTKLDATVGVSWGQNFRGEEAMRYRGKQYLFTPEIVTMIPEEDEFSDQTWMRLGRALKQQVSYLPLDPEVTWIGYWEPDNVTSGFDSEFQEYWAHVSGRLTGLLIPYHGWGDVAMVTSRQGQGLEDQLTAFARDMEVSQ